MDDHNDTQMKDFINITEALLAEYSKVTKPELYLVEKVETPVIKEESPILQECRDLVFKLRAFMEDSSGDYALGVEMGMQRAADMVENLIRRYEEGNSSE